MPGRNGGRALSVGICQHGPAASVLYHLSMDWLGLTTATAPWFFVALLSGLLGITGVIVGGVVTFKSTKASDIRRNDFERQRILSEQERADRQRWDRDLAEKAATFAQACYTVSMACERRLNELKSADASEGTPKRKAEQPDTEPWVEAGGAAVHALSDLLFIAPTEVGREAADWHAATVVLLGVTRQEDAEHAYLKFGLRDYWQEYRAHRRKLIDLVRNNLVSASMAGRNDQSLGWTPQYYGPSQPGGFAMGQSRPPGPFPFEGARPAGQAPPPAPFGR